MSKFLVYGPAGCGKKTFAEKKYMTRSDYRFVDCYSIETFGETQRQQFYKDVEPVDPELDEILVSGIDIVPRLWQRGLLTKLEHWPMTRMVFTARNISTVDAALLSRCVCVRQPSRFLDNMSFSSTDWDMLMDPVPFKVWQVPDEECGSYIRDLILVHGIQPVEFVKHALDEIELEYKEWFSSISTMSEIISMSLKINSRSQWFDLEWWVRACKKILDSPPVVVPPTRNLNPPCVRFQYTCKFE